MKIIIKNVLYIERKDIQNISIYPGWMLNNFEVVDDFFKIVDQETIDYLNSKGEVIDYQTIKGLTDEGIDDKIKACKKRLSRYSDIWKNGNVSQREFKEQTNKEQYKIKTLEDYKNNREIIDKKMQKLMKSKNLNLVL